MAKINFHLHDATVLTSEMANYDANELLNKLLDKKINAVSVGNSVVNKNMIKLVQPEHAEGAVFESPVLVTLHDGKSVLTNDSTYNPDLLAEKLNDTTAGMFVLGDLIIMKNSVRMISQEV
jgi:hypothetical protein